MSSSWGFGGKKNYTPEQLRRRRERQAASFDQPKCESCGQCLALRVIEQGSKICDRCITSTLDEIRAEKLKRFADEYL